MLHSATLILIAALGLFISLISIYGFHRFRSLRHLIIIQKRYPLIIQVECVAVILNVLAAAPSLYYAHIHDTSDTLVFFSYAQIPTIILGLFIVDFEACRLWMIGYDLHYLKASANQKWKGQISSTFAERDWYLRNRKTWGNKHYIFNRATIYFVISFVISVSTLCYFKTLHEDFLFIWFLLDAALFIAPLSLIMLSYCWSPKHLNDCLFFHFEFKTTTIAFFGGFVAYLCTIGMEPVGVEPQISFAAQSMLTFLVMSIPSLVCID